jgi:hypothetical protein|tara:strand:- start:935 stop:2203 length:1269 start_codon:yes stop_codon:yes gene_type:complete
MIDYLKKYADENGLPIMDQQSFEKITNDIGRDQFRLDLSEYIEKYRPKFPLKKITLDDVRTSFYDLQKQDISTYCNTNDNNVKEKYDDYKYNYKDYGLGVISAPSTYNSVSNYFHQELRLNCSSYSFKAPLDVWQNGNAKDIWRCLGPMWRGINNMKTVLVEGKEELRGGKLSEASYMSAFRLGTYIATQFKPNVAKTIYQLTNAKKVLDTSCGWGDRLAGFFASDAEEYIGCDPNPNTYKQYLKQIELYNSFLTKPKKVTIYNTGAEDLPWDTIKDVDCSFTSPPYFSTEEYNKGGEKEENQSWFKFNEYEKWRDDFFLPVSKKCFEVSKHTLINIMDPTIKGKRYRSCDEVVDMLKDNFVGQVGMRIMQRPKSDKLFETEEAKQEFMNKTFIENVWYFSKDKNNDLFKSVRKGTLDSFFG